MNDTRLLPTFTYLCLLNSLEKKFQSAARRENAGALAREATSEKDRHFWMNELSLAWNESLNLLRNVARGSTQRRGQWTLVKVCTQTRCTGIRLGGYAPGTKIFRRFCRGNVANYGFRSSRVNAMETRLEHLAADKRKNLSVASNASWLQIFWNVEFLNCTESALNFLSIFANLELTSLFPCYLISENFQKTDENTQFQSFESAKNKTRDLSYSYCIM